MTYCHDQLPAAQEDLDLLVGELTAVCGQLEELATMWRRQCVARNSWLDMPHAFPQGLWETAGRLTSTLRALVEGDQDQAPDLMFSAAIELSALHAGIMTAADAVTGEGGQRAQLGMTVLATMSRVRTRQLRLVGRLAGLSERPLSARPHEAGKPDRFRAGDISG